MKRSILGAALAAMALAFGGAAADDKQHGHGHGASMKSGAMASAEMTDGEIRKVDKDAGKLTIKHGEIKHMEMPPMTMVFRVKEASMLDQVKPGDKVRFTVEKKGGAMTITSIEKAK